MRQYNAYLVHTGLVFTSETYSANSLLMLLPVQLRNMSGISKTVSPVETELIG